jgi:hypothetical protein
MTLLRFKGFSMATWANIFVGKKKKSDYQIRCGTSNGNVVGLTMILFVNVLIT